LQFILPPTPVLPKGRHTAIRDEAPPIDGQSVEAMATLAMKAEKLELEDRSRGGRIGERDVCVRINTMLETENEYLCQDYLGAIGPDEGGSIDEVCRNKMCEWIFHVVDSTKLRRDTAGQAMNILDRFLGTGSRRAWEVMRSRREFQLCAITTLYIAAKIGEPYLMDATTMSKLSRGMHTVKEITKMELDILTSLRWRVNCPSPYEIANHVLELLPASAGPAAERIYSHSQFQTELATGDYAFVPLHRSTIAIAAVFNSLGGVDPEDFPIRDRTLFVQSIARQFDIDLESPLLAAVRERLLESFERSSGYQLRQTFLPCGSNRSEGEVGLCRKSVENSPGCVAKEAALSLGFEV